MLTADRRGLLTGFAALLGAEIVAPLGRALAAESAAGFEPSRMVFAAAQRATLAAASERIMPATDTPGAIAAGVPVFVEMMMADWYGETDARAFAAGLDTLDGYALAQHRKPFIALAEEQQDAVLNAAMTGKIESLPRDFFEHCRQVVILGYYTSEIGCTQERTYLPVPGRYDGSYPYANVRRIFSS